MSAVTMPAAPSVIDRREALAGERQRARDLYRASLANGRPLNGPQMAEVTGRTPRWCTKRIGEVHAEQRPVPTPAPVETPRSESERPTPREAPVSPWLERTAVALVGLVFAVSALTSYLHQRTFAEQAGEDMAGLLPLTVDALVFAALLSIHVFRKLGEPVPHVVRGCLWLGVAASIGANMAAAHAAPGEHSSLASLATAAWPPVVAFLTHEMVTKLTAALSKARRS